MATRQNAWAVDAEVRRRKELSAIHVLKTQAAMTEDEYRAMLASVTGKDSAGELNQVERRRVLDYFARMGVKSTARIRRENLGERAPLFTKIDALLEAAGRDRAYLKSMVRRMTGAEDLGACGAMQLQKLVVALTMDANRHGRAYA